MTSRYEHILFIAVISICSNLICISTLSNELPSSLGMLGKYDTSRTVTPPKQHKVGARVLSSLDKLALLYRNEKMNAVEVPQISESDYRKNGATVNQNYLLQQRQQPRILPTPPQPPFNYLGKNKPFTQINYEDNNDDDDDDDDDDNDNEYMDDKEDTDDDEIDDDYDILQLAHDIKIDKEIALKSSGLLKLLLDIPSGPLPIVYIEETNTPQIPYYGLVKRGGRYNQRYPWKRENSLYRRESIHPETRFHCIPSREEVFRLLLGLHENRNGNEPKTVRFCNRRRPARSILTSIRFMG